MKKTSHPLKKLIANNLYSRYSSILPISDISILLIDVNGDILLEFNPSPDFCKHVCQKKGSRICDDYLKRLKTGQQTHFVCRYGLENVILPVVSNEVIQGYIVGIQAYSKETEYLKYMIDSSVLASNKDLDFSMVAKAMSLLRTIDKNQMEIHEQICAHIAKNISLDITESLSNVQNTDVARLSIEKELLEKKIIDLEAKNMSLLINPHFLFNTLNSIARIAYFENSHTTEELIYCLSDLLRYNLKNEDQLHTIEAEVNNVEKYLYIQKVRFKNRLEYSIDIPDSVKPYRIPSMVLQPIVENALIHGITPKRDGGSIKIYAEKDQKQIVIAVVDDGNGFPHKVLNDIRNNADSKSGLGFRTTDGRLKQYFGSEYGLEIVKSDYSGSTVTITIPNHLKTR